MRKLISSADIAEGTSKGVHLDGKGYILIRYESKIYVYVNSCPHLEIPLEWQANNFLDSDGELIRCSTHGALFTIEDGLCISGPCNGQFLTAVPHQLVDDEILID